MYQTNKIYRGRQKIRESPREKPKFVSNEQGINKAVLLQKQRVEKYNYQYRKEEINGNINNNTTLYLLTDTAHLHQIEEIFNKAIQKAKSMPEIFGEDFECDYKINLVKNKDNVYMGHAYIDLSNPKLYYALIGFNVDGTERVELEEIITDIKEVKLSINKTESKSWADITEEEEKIENAIKNLKNAKKLPPLLTLDPYLYDEDQRKHFLIDKRQAELRERIKITKDEAEKQRLEAEIEKLNYGMITVSPSFITPGWDKKYDNCCLRVMNVPAKDYNFLYNIFARYAKAKENDKFILAPFIEIYENPKDNTYYALVRYADPYDTAFALQMLKKIRTKYNGKEVIMNVNYNFNKTQ